MKTITLVTVLQRVTQCLLIGSLLAFAGTSLATERVTYYHNDALGSPVAATDANGTLLWREEYRPYGERLKKEAGSKDTIWYTGKQEELTFGLNYFGARWYDPKVGRFIGVDPVGFSEDNIHSYSKYAYANNNPYVYVDPDGRESVKYGSGFGLGSGPSGYHGFGGSRGAAGNLFGGVPRSGPGATGTNATKSVPNKGIYQFTDKVTGKPYVGQSGNIDKRLRQHEKAGKLDPGSAVVRTEVAGGKTSREIAEHGRIQKLTGGVPARRSPDVANKVDPIGPKRQHLLR